MRIAPLVGTTRLPLPPLVAALLATALPSLLAYNLPPSATLLNQCLAAGLWGGFVLVLAPATYPSQGRALLAALGAMLCAIAWSGAGGSLPEALTLSALALVAAAAILAWTGIVIAGRDDAGRVFACFCFGLAAAGVLSALVALIQVFAPDWTDGNVLAHSGLVGRAVGNLRQPNHLCTLLLWGVVGVVASKELGRLHRHLAIAAVFLQVFAVELSASRTGALGLVLLALWGLLDRRLSRSTRGLLIATPVVYAISYGAMALYGDWSHQAIGAEARIAAGEGSGIESPNSRTRIWANAMALIAQQPWAGVGFGEFNLAWSLTPFPGRPTAFFDHTHTLPLQLAVELGLPLAMLILGLLMLALWQAWQRSREASGDVGVAARSAWVLTLLTGLHSLFEYPLWYAYFLLPAAFAWGFSLGAAPGDSASRRQHATKAWIARMIGGAMALGGVFAILDYMRVVEIYAPGNNAGPLEARITAGQRSLLFAHHADYAAATSAEPLPGTRLAFQRAPHYLMDTRLMIAWARHLASNGRLDLARTLAARLREFRNSDSDEFFAPCLSGDTQAFQCQSPQAPHKWREFLEAR